MIVLDASVCVSILFFDDMYHADSLRWWGRQSLIGTRYFAPTLLFVEVAGVLARRTGRPDIGHRTIARLRDEMGIQLVPLDRDRMESYARLAADLRLRGADATYVAVAREIGVPLVTWDGEQLSRAARIIPVFTPDEFPRDEPTGNV